MEKPPSWTFWCWIPMRRTGRLARKSVSRPQSFRNDGAELVRFGDMQKGCGERRILIKNDKDNKIICVYHCIYIYIHIWYHWTLVVVELRTKQDVTKEFPRERRKQQVVQWFLDNPTHVNAEQLVGGFKHVLFPISYMGCHPSHWRTPSFFKIVKTTNQI